MAQIVDYLRPSDQKDAAKEGERTSYPTRPAYKTQHYEEDESHQTVSSFFLGPKAENFDWFKKQLDEILEAVRDARLDYFPRDPKGITPEIQSSTAFRKSARKMSNAIRQASRLLATNSVPFWSPRYQGHMCMDMSMPALLGYFMTMMYNPNNVTIEVSPLTTVAEICVGDDLCEMFGFNVDPENTSHPLAWGHITCDGTVANLESVWVARNLKYYPLALRRALDGPLSFIADRFEITTCNGTKPKKFVELDSWELLNLRSGEILDIPKRLYDEFYISPQFLDGIMKTYGIQTTSKRVMDDEFGVKQGRYFVSNTKHYSWPKSAAITGIGSENVIGLKVDYSARVDVTDLEEQLQFCLDEKIPVFAVVAIIGSTEEGCIDPLKDILKLRTKFQEQGLSFLVHGDGAWGGYFCNMLPLKFEPGQPIPLPSEGPSPEGFVPDAGLKQETAENLYMLREADSVTVDPHKAAYIPYPAGGLCYRDGRLRYLVTWTSPYISRGETNATSIGVFGVEGSKPGASVMSTWLANQCIGLGPEGYGKLLGEVTFTCSRLAAEWAAMTEDDVDDFRVVPLNKLPVEYDKDCTPGKIKAQRKFIRENILNKSNFEIVEEDMQREGEKNKAMWLLRELGSDLNINAFGANWKYKDGKWNDDVEEANYFNQLVIQDLSIDSPEDEPTKIPFYLTSTTFMIHEYGECAQHLKKRLGLIQDDTDILVMRNVVMSPWPTDKHFLNELMGEYKSVMAKHVETCRERNNKDPETHDFLLQGTEKVYAVHFPMFNLGKHRQQVIFEIKLSPEAMDQYVTLKKEDPEAIIILRSIDPILLDHLTENQPSFKGAIGKKVPKPEPVEEKDKKKKKVAVEPKNKGVRERDYDVQVSILSTDIQVASVVKARSLKAQYRDRMYPDSYIPFYLYGTKNNMNIDHVLVRSPNISLSAENVTFTPSSSTTTTLTDEHLAKGCILAINNLSEAAMQPFQSTEGHLKDTFAAGSGFFFAPDQEYTVDIYEDPFGATETGPGLVDVTAEHTHASDSAAHLHNHGHGVPKGATGGGKAFRHVDANVHVSGITGTTPAAKKSSGLTNGVMNGDGEEKPKKEFKLISSGTIKLGRGLYIDSVQINKDPFYVAEGAEKFKKWKKEFDTIGKELE